MPGEPAGAAEDHVELDRPLADGDADGLRLVAAGRRDQHVGAGARGAQRVPAVLAGGAAADLPAGDVDEGERGARARCCRRGAGRCRRPGRRPWPVGARRHGRGRTGWRRRRGPCGGRSAAEADVPRDRGVVRVAVRRVRGPAGHGGVGHQRFLLEEEGEQEAEDEHRHEIEEDPRHGVRVRVDVAVAQRRGQGVHQLRGDRLGVGQPRRPAAVRSPSCVGEPVGEEGAEDGGADAAADLPEVVVGAGRGAEVGGAYGVLHGEHQHRHDEADAEAEDAHPEAVDLARGVLPPSGTAATSPRRTARSRATGKTL